MPKLQVKADLGVSELCMSAIDPKGDLGGSARLWLDQREHGAKGDAVAIG